MSVTRCFTFGSGHAEKLGIPWKSFVRITAESDDACRNEMFKRYGNQWAFSYSEEQIAEQVRKFGLVEVNAAEAPTVKKKFLVRYNVEYSRQVEADSEQGAIDRALLETNDRDGWHQEAKSQLEAEEIQ